MNTVLGAEVEPYVQQNNGAIFMHDNARPHVAQAVPRLSQG